MRIHSLLLLVTLTPVALPQALKIPPSIEKLGQSAREVVDITMDPGMLGFASRFMNESKAGDAKAKNVLRGIKNLRVRSFEFDAEGAYSPSDVETLRHQMNAPGWSRMVQVQSKKDRENVDVFMRSSGGKISGLVVLVAEPKELTIVDIEGTIRPEDIASLGGRAGIPAFHFNAGARSGQ